RTAGRQLPQVRGPERVYVVPAQAHRAGHDDLVGGGYRTGALRPRGEAGDGGERQHADEDIGHQPARADGHAPAAGSPVSSAYTSRTWARAWAEVGQVAACACPARA